MEAVVEGTLTGVDHITDKHGEQIYDRVTETYRNYAPGRKGRGKDKGASGRGSQASAATANTRRHRNSLPSPERDAGSAYTYTSASRRRQDSLERESQRSAQILREYENEPDDPRRDPYTALGGAAAAAAAAGCISSDRKSSTKRRDSTRMSEARGYTSERPRSQPPKSRYEYDSESDYDERTGTRYRGGGRGYDSRDRSMDGGEPYREYYETERYRGPARNFDSQFKGPSGAATALGPPPADSEYGAGALAPYRRNGARTDVSGRTRSKSRGRSADSRSRSRSRSRSHSGARGKLDHWFDKSPRGIGVGIAGAVVGGFVGREFGNREHRKRDMVIGAVVGGLGANAAENKWHEYRHPEERNHKRDLSPYGYDDRRARSSMR